MSSSSFYFSSYFIVNTLLVVAYPILRIYTQAGERDLRHRDQFGFTYENSIIYTAIALATIAYLRSASPSQFLTNCFTVGKIGVVCLLFFAKIIYSFYYLLACLLLWMVLPYPKYRAPNKFIQIKTVQQFEQIVDQKQPIKSQKILARQKQETQKYGYQYRHKKMFFIQFYADWVIQSQFAKQIWYQYSKKYTTESLKFISINVDKLPSLAKRFKINATGFSKQLPTVLMIDDGQQTCRFPPIDDKGKVSKVHKLDYKILLQYFDLESRFLQTRYL